MWPRLNESDTIAHKFKGDEQPPRVQSMFVTKGDANAEHDWWLYDYEKRKFMLQENLMGTLLGNSPAIGFMTIGFKESKLFQIFFYSLVVFSGFIGYAEG